MAVAMIATAQAQDTNEKSRKRMDPSEMIQKRTQEMTEKYALSTEQAEKVKALNEKYMGQMGPRGGQRPPQMKDGERPEPPKDGERPQGGHRGHGGPDMTKYNEELKTILNDTQYKAYEADEATRHNHKKTEK